MAITMKQARVGLDLSQEEMAKALEVSSWRYRKWEQNPETMPVSAAKKFCEIAGVHFDDIIFA